MAAESYRHEMRANLRLAWPIIAAQMSMVSMSTVDTLLAGRLGATTLAAVAVGANIFFLVFVFFLGLFMAVSPIVAQQIGARVAPEQTGQVLRGTLVLAVVAGAVWSALLWVVGPPVLRLLSLSAAAEAGALAYLHAVSLAPVGFCLAFTLRNAAEAHGLTRISLAAGVAGFVVNALAGWLLVFGHAGLPRMGAAGTGIATGLAGWSMVVVYTLAYRRHPRLRPLRMLRPGRWASAAASREVLRLGLPIAAILTAEGSLFLVGALFMARFGEAVVAAHQVAINFASLSFMVPLSVGLATTVRVGTCAGAGDEAGVARAGRAGMAMGVLFALASATLMALLPGPIVRLYTNAPEVLPLATHFLGFAALFQLADCVQATANGALRGVKDTRLPMLITVLAYWVVGLPLAALLAFATPVGPAGVWCGFIGGLVVAAVGLAWRFLRLHPTKPV
jgi:multidrug resistance protein, MATE family